MKRRTPAARAPSSRWSVPSVRSRLVSADSRSNRLGLRMQLSAVTWGITASGPAPATAARTAARSRASAVTGCAPTALSHDALPASRVIAATSYPPATSRGTSRRPIAPLPPATNTFITVSFPADVPVDETPAPAVTPAAGRGHLAAERHRNSVAVARPPGQPGTVLEPAIESHYGL